MPCLNKNKMTIGYYDEHPISAIGIKILLDKYFINIVSKELTLEKLIEIAWDLQDYSVLILGVSSSKNVTIAECIKHSWPNLKILILNSEDNEKLNSSFADLHLSKHNELPIFIQFFTKIIGESQVKL